MLWMKAGRIWVGEDNVKKEGVKVLRSGIASIQVTLSPMSAFHLHIKDLHG